MNQTETDGTNPFQVILLATDGSEFSAGVERVGVEMAAQHGSRLHVLRLLLADPGSDASIVEEQDAALNMERVNAMCAERGITCENMLRHAEEPSQGILAAVREVGAQLLILGRRGRRGMAKLMVGDATTRLLEKAECSVLVVPRLFSYWSSGVILALDAEENDGDHAALGAFHLAQHAGLPLTILKITDEGEADRLEVNQAVNRLVAMAKLREIDADGVIQSGDNPDDLILEVARQRSGDIIVCEPRDRSMIDRLFHVNKLVHLIGRAHCPVMVVPARAAA
ncbi:MAG: universal stress protein [Magnetococcales bacterium]|nr:universal stress protein [Magnetococcales bacterium]